MKNASKLIFFANFRQLQKKLPICKKRYAEILHVPRAVVTIVEKKVKRRNRIFFGSHLEEQSVNEHCCIDGSSGIILVGTNHDFSKNFILFEK